jgi:hypothetical protein
MSYCDEFHEMKVTSLETPIPNLAFLYFEILFSNFFTYQIYSFSVKLFIILLDTHLFFLYITCPKVKNH